MLSEILLYNILERGAVSQTNIAHALFCGPLLVEHTLVSEMGRSSGNASRPRSHPCAQRLSSLCAVLLPARRKYTQAGSGRTAVAAAAAECSLCGRFSRNPRAVRKGGGSDFAGAVGVCSGRLLGGISGPGVLLGRLWTAREECSRLRRGSRW